MRIVIASGGFDPLHSGHVAYLEAAADLGDKLIVGVNSDAWLMRKKGYCMMPFAERLRIVSALFCVDEALGFEDSDGSARALIRTLLTDEDEFVFVNGGDRTAANIPEQDIVAENLMFQFGVGGADKLNSSSSIVRIPRPWGYYQVVYHATGVKVKRLIINPRSAFSYQRHQHRDEYWLVVRGAGVATIEEDQFHMEVGQSIYVRAGQWHRMKNRSDHELEIVEVQSGSVLEETDIERMF